MESKIKDRSVIRRLFTKAANSLEAILNRSHDVVEIKSSWRKLSDLRSNLENLDAEIKLMILGDPNFLESVLEKEYEEADNYKTRWLLLDTRWENLMKLDNEEKLQNIKCENSKISLPKLEIVKFDGDIKNWLSFWAHFKSIHEDEKLKPEHKFQYLLQAIVPGTEARSLVESYPVSAENYNECIKHLKLRYAREELLVQYYVRELLSLILQKRENNLDLTYLYDKLSAQLRALETLGVAKVHAAFILPMVESALPDDILRAWERSTTHCNKMQDELDNLLKFLEREVESNQRIQMAKSSFNTKVKEESTASCLVSTTKGNTVSNTQTKSCIWCDKNNHTSLECYKIYKLSLGERKEHLKNKRACINCFKPGHNFKTCKAFIKCLICGKRHATILCPDQKFKSNEGEPASQPSSTVTSLATQGSTLLQTLIVEIQYQDKKMPVRAMIDSGSQRTYVKQEVIDKLQIPPIRKEILSHSLFGGLQTKTEEHNTYNITVKSVDQSFQIDMIALSQNCICNNVPSVNCNDSKIFELLKSKNIILTVKGQTSEIDLLIGADFSGFILTGAVVQLGNGLVAIGTLLGWTLQGRVGHTNKTITNLMCINNDLAGYWSLETLGIRDPITVKSKEVAAAETMASFEDTIKVNLDGRYEVQLPFKVGYESLLPNYEIAKSRLDSTTRKLVICDRFDEYNTIFQDWLSLGIIEQVPEADINHKMGHYLPHRPVIKDSSLTSTIRPVFDASASDKNGLSLNSCLEKGINFIDLIPNLLVGFRKGAIGITSDIEKAFLQISLPTPDRHYLKFLWWENKSMLRIIEYRHCRVVFGLTSSPFLLSATLMHHLEGVTGENQETAQRLKISMYVGNCLTSLDTEQETYEFITKSKPIQTPTAPLPPERLESASPFQVTGVDLAGPLFLRNGEKVWIVLFTCAVYRAVHLELTRSLSTEAFIMCLRRFIARRGRSDMLMSDNGTNFHGTKNSLTSLDWEEVQRSSTIRRISWMDKGDCLEPLTPAYFIQPIPTSDADDLDQIDVSNLNRHLQYLQNLRDQFRQRFKTEYLYLLVQRGKEKNDIIKVGDL